MEEWESIIRILADDTRRGIVFQLLTHDRCVGSLAQWAGVSEAAVSQHLKALREVGLVTGEKRGYFTHYKVNREVIQSAAGKLLEWAAIQPVQSCGSAHRMGENPCHGKEGKKHVQE